MSMQIAILGLGQIGTSIGLALAGNKSDLVRVGNDRDLATARKAERIGALDKTVINLHSTVENAPIVVLALPVDEIEKTLETIAPTLQPGTVVIDTAPVRVPLIEMAGRLLGEERFYITMTPAVNPAYLLESDSGVDAAHADLFKNSLMSITSAPGVPSKVIQLASDLATLLGGIPFYPDALEADGLTAGTHILPVLAAAAMMHANAGQPGWREGRKLAGPGFAQATLPVTQADESEQYGTAALLNGENAARVIDNLIAELQVLRERIAEKDLEGLSEYLKEARELRETWLVQRTSGNWDTAKRQSMPTSAEVLGRLIGWRPKKK